MQNALPVNSGANWSDWPLALLLADVIFFWPMPQDSLAEWSKAFQAPVRKGVGSNPTGVNVWESSKRLRTHIFEDLNMYACDT